MTTILVVSAHPDDETLWAGGLLLSHPEWEPFIVTLCRDARRAARSVATELGRPALAKAFELTGLYRTAATPNYNLPSRSVRASCSPR